MSNKVYALTTIDNPYDPFIQFDAWYRYDLNRELTHRDELYVNCCSILDRYAKTSDGLSEYENSKEIERAIDEIIKTDPMNVYVKVEREVGDADEIDPDDKSFIDLSSRFLK